MFKRDDGLALLLPGLNYVFGDSGDGKSFVALMAVVAEIRAGHPVIWITYEDANEDLAVERLRLLGATEEEAERVMFHHPADRADRRGAAYRRARRSTGPVWSSSTR